MAGINKHDREDHDDPQAENCKLFLGGLNPETTEETLKQHFGKWGDIVDCVVMRYRGTKKARGFGYVTYKTAEMLNDAQNNRPHMIDDRKVDTKRAIPRGQSIESYFSVTKMFVGGLKEDIAEDDIREVFGRFGKIEKLDMIKDRNTGKQKSFCFITFDDYDSVDKCVLMQRISVGGKSVEMRKAFLQDPDYGKCGGRGGFRGGMRGRGGFGGGIINSYCQGNYGYPGNMGANGGHGWYGDCYQGNYDYGMGGHYGWGRNYFNYGYNNFGYGCGPNPYAGYSRRIF